MLLPACLLLDRSLARLQSYTTLLLLMLQGGGGDARARVCYCQR
jgi:hypothetical protein